jgi:hypothetical protein
MTVLVLQYYRNRGAIAAGRSPERRRFSTIGIYTFSPFYFRQAIFLIFPS